MKKIIVVLFTMTIGMFAHAQLFSTLSGKVGFFSKTPMEDIDGTSHKTLAVLNITKNEMAIIITNTTFEFPNKLMEEHFNEKYMQSDKYPTSTFKGKINEAIDLSKDGEYKVTSTGKLNIHGVELERTIPGTIIVKGGEIKMTSSFPVNNADHKIEIPSLVATKIAESLDVSVELVLLPRK
ncbi:MAG: YceI family protein [Bacteroidetes bacterium]|nr:YceI family protein [Bacteroidota bacterium]